MRGEYCLGVRDRRSGRWIGNHPALRGRLTAGYQDGEGMTASHLRVPLVGECLVFGDGHQLQTSPVLMVEEREAHTPMGEQEVEAMRCVRPPPRPRDTHEGPPR